MQSEDHHRTALLYPLVHWTLWRCQQYSAFSVKALARYQVILLGEQRHIRCEQLAQGCCPNSAAVGVEPATSWSRVQRPTATPPSLEWKVEGVIDCESEGGGCIYSPLIACSSSCTETDSTCLVSRSCWVMTWHWQFYLWCYSWNTEQYYFPLSYCE